VGAQNDFGTSGCEVLDGGEGSTDAGVICDFEGVVFWDIEVDPDEDFFSGNIEITDSEFIHNRRAFECLMVAGVSRMEEFGEGRSKFWVRRRGCEWLLFVMPGTKKPRALPWACVKGIFGSFEIRAIGPGSIA